MALASAPSFIETTAKEFRTLALRLTEADQVPEAVLEAMTGLAPPLTMIVVLASAVPVSMMGLVLVDCAGVVMTGCAGGAAQTEPPDQTSESTKAAPAKRAALWRITGLVVFMFLPIS